MLATSLGDVWSYDQVPGCFFGRKYRNAQFVAYNLAYDEGAILQCLPRENLKELREKGVTKHDDYRWKIIPKKMLSISKGKNAVTFWDMYNFYHSSLDYNAQKYLDEQKAEIETKTFSREYVRDNWETISKYCVHDARLVQRLAEHIIGKFEAYGVYPKRLYSTAYVSYQHFKRATKYVTVRRFWEEDKRILGSAMAAYNGGKFEVTRKGVGYYYEYDIVSAYPNEIRNLVDISHARVVRSRSYRKYAVYGFLLVFCEIPSSCFSPTVIKRGQVNTYPVGKYKRWVTKQEYEYLLASGADITIIDGWWLHVDTKTFPYREEIDRLVRLKQQYKHGDPLDYHTVKILLNSLYGKFVQLIDKGQGRYRASACWNPIYGAVITANVRIRISNLQTVYPSIAAVHTDSVISDKPLPFAKDGALGDLVFECEGDGLILGSGIYQIGDKVRFRGFPLSISLFDLLATNSNKVSLDVTRAYSWREVIFHNWPDDMINRFETAIRQVAVNFDQKRLWLNDWERWTDVEHRSVESVPLIASSILY